MRMLLTSNGLTNELLQKTALELLGRPFADSRIVVLIDAILPFSNDSHTLRNLNQLNALGWREFDLMSLFGGPQPVIERRLRDADIILGYGGTNHWQAHAWTSTGFAPLLGELLDEKVYVGWSAGSMIFSRLHERFVEAFDDQEEVAMLGLDSVGPALPLFDWALVPHLGASYFPNQTDEWAAEHAARLAAPAYFLDDDSALLIRDAAAAPEVISSGHWLRFDDAGRLAERD